MKPASKLSPHFNATLALLCAADRIRSKTAELLSLSGLTLPQFNSLRILRGAGEPLPIMEVRRRLIERTPGITRIIDGLEKMNLVARIPCPGDRRATLCKITAAGLALIKSLDKPIERNNRALLGALSAAELKQLVRTLAKIT